VIAVPSIASFAPYLSLDECIDATARAFALERADIIGRSRIAPIAFARACGMFVARRDCNPERSYPQIATAFGDRDHTTILVAHDKIAGELDAQIIRTMRGVARVRAEIERARR
jgi:chromosomal replication initiator protein